ncbi:FAD-dependent oxidoreductase [Gordonia sp. ABSL1-1]|uniref:oxidoreductase n=1 Tax=Gordonia sp. ABSL1-1 TaxID=3053923 RepID=UPI002573B12E|nr:FAD-dependent oxidoreductase [Gordonia sp. ABSL1-1]MDL9938646.1 FAD-dependent oxidoreductase [Gordonia sp. ABSL1-1]
MPTNDPLLQPFELKHLRLRNRVVSTAHEPAYAEDGMPKDRYLRYHAEKAKGGLALTMIGGAACVSPEAPAFVNNIALYRDEVVPYLVKVADAVHEHGALVMSQVTHPGRRTSNYEGDWLPIVSSSGQRERAHRAVPKAAEDWDITRIVTAYADAAERCAAAGLDGIELMAHSHLIDQFLSPAINDRDDEWGGSLENRLRFPLDLVRAIRHRVGEEFVVGIRIGVDEGRDGGNSVDEGIEVVRRLGEAGIDFVNVICGNLDSDRTMAEIIAPMGTPSAPHLDFAGRVRAAIDIPVLHAGRIADLPTARHAIEAGLVDLVGMTRAHIADPHLMRRLVDGEEDRIRPCVGAGYCIDRVYEGADAFCIHNAATGRETSIPHEVAPAPDSKSTVVVGAGPAGLEAARVLAERGHRVTVLEAASEPGGQLLVAAAAPRRRDLIGIVDWRVAECRRLGVTFRYNTFAEVDDVLAEDADVVVVATGGIPDAGTVKGADLITDGWQILSRETNPGETVLLYDDNGDHQGMNVAEAVARSGADLEFVTPERTVAPLVGASNYPAYLRTFAEQGVRTTLNAELVAVARTEDRKLAVTLRDAHVDVTSTRIVDQVIAEHGTVPNDELYFDLKPHSRNRGDLDFGDLLALRPQHVTHNGDSRFQLFRIGDAVTSRNVHAAILDANRLCQAI